MSTSSNGAQPVRSLRAKAAAGLVVLALSLAPSMVAAQGRPAVVWAEGGHGNDVTAVDLSADGALMATSSDDETLKLWRYPQGELLRTIVMPDDLQAQVSGIRGARFTRDGARVIAAVNRVDGQGGSFGAVQVFRVADGTPVRTFGQQQQGIASIDLSPDGEWVATAGPVGGVMIWRVSDGTLVEHLVQHPGGATGVHFSPMGDRLCAGYDDRTLASWKTSDWSLLWAVDAHQDTITSAVFSDDGMQIATTSSDGTAKLFDAADGRLRHTLSAGTALLAAATSPDGVALATGGGDGRIRLWDLAQGTLIRQFDDSHGAIVSLRFTADGRVLISGGEFPSRIRRWNPADGTQLRPLTRLSSLVAKVRFSPDAASVAIAARFDERVDVFDAATGRRAYAWNTHVDTPDVALSPDGRLAALPGSGNTVVIRRLSDGKVVRTLAGHADNVVGLAFSHDGALLASGSFFPGSIRLWRTSDWTLVREIEGGTGLGAFGPFESFSFSPDDRLLGVVAEAAPLVLRVADGTVIARPQAISYTAAFSPDGLLFVVSGGPEGAGDDVQVYRVSDWTLVRTLSPGAHDIAFDPEGKLLLVAHTDALRVWRTSDWALVKTYDQELGYLTDAQGVQSLAVAPDGAQFAYGRFDATLVVARNPWPDQRPPVRLLTKPAQGSFHAPPGSPHAAEPRTIADVRG